MIVKDAKAIVRQWAIEAASQTPGFYGAFYAGSIGGLADGVSLPATSDVDVWLVVNDSAPPGKLGKFIYRRVLLDVSYMARDRLQSPELVLGDYHLAGSFRFANIILDPSGQLTRLQTAVSAAYAQRRWVVARCQQARNKVLNNLQGLNEPAPFHDQVAAWLFAAGVTTHILLVAGLKNPTVRRRYVAVRELLAAYQRTDFYERLLALLGCEQMSQAQVEHHLDTLTDAFDAAKAVVKSPFFFASDISDIARPIAIDGSRELIEQGHHREAVFWLVATYCRCQKIIYHDAPALLPRFTPGFRQLLGDLGITSASDLHQRSDQIKRMLPVIWTVAQAIMDANPEIIESPRLQ